MQVVAAIVLAAGKGTRMRSRRAKVLHPLLGKPLLAYPLEACRRAGIGRIVTVIGPQAEEIASTFAGPDVSFAIQAEQRGTGDAVLSAREALEGFSGTALLLCGDVPLIRPETLTRLLDAHRGAGARVTVLSMVPPEPRGYGRLVREGGRLLRIVEERDADAETRAIHEVNTGTYAVEAPWLWTALEGLTAANDQGEYYLTDIVETAAREGGAQSLLLDDPEEVMGVNSRAHLAEASAAARRRINRAWMEAGVTLEDPASTWIEPDVELAEDVVLAPSCRLTGKTRVGEGAQIGQGCVISDSEIGPEALVKPYCVVSGATVAAQAQIGPFAHLRPGAEIGPSAHVGNFVELKKSKLGRGSKANHLTYLGDATIGEGVNIGAGTITCNYDGVAKHRTIIGDGAFIGSNASLVAPVTVGPAATVAAGSTITQDVPPGSLGVGRQRQQNIEGWGARPKSRRPGS
ncbi:MAG: bifunctional UDP-N-acetylglucosamine diphosphorylase/glucosamine-1-phosphate N-acetyltransferase GlmU [Deltaproteobacteria bacterium]|nr:bifunctional UDP-N-acetylglucosamine diphosphorylase/glucosamine-1-phosphate N-acetyltransferase GlmU [Deltaproteobacteria bacterium]